MRDACVLLLIATRGPATSAGMTLVDGDHWAEFLSWAGPLDRKSSSPGFLRREHRLCVLRLRNLLSVVTF